MGAILYVGDLRPGTTCCSRRDALLALGESVVGVDVAAPPGSVPSLLERLRFRLGYPADPMRVNPRTLVAAEAVRPEIVWIDAVRLLRLRTLSQVRGLVPQALLVGFVVDDPFPLLGARGWRRFRGAARGYDVLLVPRPESVGELRALGAPRVERFEWGFDPVQHQPVGTPGDGSAGEVFFAGHWEPKREGDLAFLAEHGEPLRVWGDADWRRGPHWHTLETVFTAGGVYGTDYARAITSSKIALCFYSRWNRDVQNTRMYEIPACGGFLLAERTAENGRVFREDVEAAYFDTRQELLEKVRYYLAHDAEREAIARRGRERCLASGYSYPDRMGGLLRVVRGARGASAGVARG